MERKATITIPASKIRNMNILLSIYEDDGLKTYGLPMDKTVAIFNTTFDNGYSGELELYAGYGGFFIYIRVLDTHEESIEYDCFDDFYEDDVLGEHCFEDDNGDTYYLTIEEGE